MEDILIFIILLLAFTSGTVYNFNKRKQCEFQTAITKPRIIIVVAASIIFYAVAYIGGNTIPNYLLSTFSGIFVLSALISEGIHREGIIYMPGKPMLSRLVK